MTDLSKVDAQVFLERVAAEVAKRFNRGLPIAGTSKNLGPPFCAVCETPGRCAAVCSDSTGMITDAGADRIGGSPGIGSVERRIANMIDHTLLKADASKDQVAFLCAEAAKYEFASVCVNPFWVPFCAEMLQGHQVKVCTVIGFPLGANQPDVKAAETRLAVTQGADEIDMVINVGALKSGMLDVVEADIRAVRDATGPGVVLKVILETALLDDHEKVAGCEASMRAGADFVKTSTGFSTGGATAGDVALMRRVVGEGVGVKASGGVRNKRDANLMIASGANRIGASAGVKIMHEIKGLSPGVRKATNSGGGGGY